MKRLLVVGASGFTGRALIGFLRGGISDSGCEIIGMDVTDSPNLCDKFKKCDACDGEEVRSALRDLRPDMIFNLTGSFSARGYADSVRLNTEPTRNLCEAILDIGLEIEKLVVIGSAAEYGMVRANPVRECDETRPVGFYGLAKVYQTHLARFYASARGMPIVIARPFNISGTGQSSALAIGNWERQIAEARDGGAIKVGNLETKRDYVDIGRVVELYWLLARRGVPGEIYNICSGTATRMGDVLEQMISRSGKKLRVETDVSLIKKDDIPEIFGCREKIEALLL